MALTIYETPPIADSPEVSADMSPVLHSVPEPLEAQLQARFDPTRLDWMCRQFLARGVKDPDNVDPLLGSPLPINLWDRIDGKEFVVGLLGPESPFKDIAIAVETQRFAQKFKRSLSEIYREYDEYHDTSRLLVVIDVRNKNELKPAGAMRIIEHSPDKLQKSIADIVADIDKPKDYPWRADLQALGILAIDPEPGQNEPRTVWQRFCDHYGVDIKPEESLDIATVANMEEYGTDGALDGVSMLLYHSCLRYMLARTKPKDPSQPAIKHLVSIQDLRPLEILQRFGSPFDTFPGLPDHPYGGPYLTRPAYATYPEGLERIRKSDEAGLNGQVFINGSLINETALLLSHQDKARYGNEAVGLEPEVFLSAL